jgi:hypothetical protein
MPNTKYLVNMYKDFACAMLKLTKQQSVLFFSITTVYTVYKSNASHDISTSEPSSSFCFFAV